MCVFTLSLLVLLVGAAPPGTLRHLVESHAADSLPGPLSHFEAAHRGAEAGEAAFVLGQLRYARGEYRQAAEAFARAARRLGTQRRGEARYWAGLAWLGAGDLAQARAYLDDAAGDGMPRRSEALLALALCWESARRPERALETLQRLLADEPGEAGAPALERVAVLSEGLGRPEQARRARDRLARDYPRSFEALRAGLSPLAQGSPAAEPPARPRAPAPREPAEQVSPPPKAVNVPLAVQIGAFRDPVRARALAGRARRAGFAPVRVSAREDALGTLYAVRVGVYATAEDAQGAGQRLARALRVRWLVVPAP
jgi:tetratricopeptide (TPR) repeat protein